MLTPPAPLASLADHSKNLSNQHRSLAWVVGALLVAARFCKASNNTTKTASFLTRVACPERRINLWNKAAAMAGAGSAQ